MHKMGSPKLHIEAVQTIVPSTVTDPRLTRKVSAANGPISSENLRGCLHLVLYYKASSESESDSSGWSVAGFIKGSLGMALSEQPFLAGRLRQGGDGEFEVVSNDSGVRLVEAKMDLRLSEVLALEGDEMEGVESNLVFWKEIDEQYPQFSPLLYVQVTNFECGGYSVAISCSLVVVDNVVVTKFLKNWANVHETMMSQNGFSTLPIFYVPNMKRTGASPTIPVNSSKSQTRGHTMMFKASIGQDVMTSDVDFYKMLAWLCLEEAEDNLGQNMGSDITFFIKEAQEAMKMETCRRDDHGLAPSLKSGIKKVNWEDLGAKEVAFVKGSNPMRVSYWIGSISCGIVMAIPSTLKDSSDFLNVIVTFLKN